MSSKKSGLQIVPTDIRHTSVGISGVSKVSLVIAERLYKKLVAVTNYKSLQVTDVTLQYGLLFKLINDIATTIDSTSIDLAKVLKDSAVIDSVTAIELRKSASDILDLVDAFGMDINKAFSDSSTAVDFLVIELVKAFTDVVSVTEQLVKDTIKYREDTASVLDDIVVSVGYFRSFADAVAIDDIASVDKYYNAVKHNVASTSDTSKLGFTKSLFDQTNVNDLPSWVYEKPINDLLSTSDSISFSTHLNLSDFITLLDEFSYTRGKFKNTADNVGIGDTLVLSTTRPANDQLAANDDVLLELHKSLIDSASVSSYNRIHVLTKLSESFSASDNVVVTVVRGGSSMFNASLFNQSTFG